MKDRETVRLSLAAAIALGFKNGRFLRGARPGTLNILLNPRGGCRARCAYCGLARGGTMASTFIRVVWPEYGVGEVKERLSASRELAGFRRICLAGVTAPGAFQALCSLLEEFTPFGLPVSVLVGGNFSYAQLAAFREGGADMLGVGLDCATPELFDRLRGRGVGGPHTGENYLKLIEDGLAVFGRGRVGVHLIVGLGETEQEMVLLMQKLVDLGAEPHLFSFCPEPGSLLAGHRPPPLGQYRRLQVARYLITRGVLRAEDLTYNSAGQIADFGGELSRFAGTGEPFRTSGCPGRDGTVACNRPFGNERPSEIPRNYPYPPSDAEAAAAWAALREDLAC